MSNNKKNIGRYFKKGTLGFKILFLSLIFVFLSVSVFSPFMLIDGANKTLGIVLLCIIVFVYLLILINYVWDWLKAKYGPDNDSNNKKS